MIIEKFGISLESIVMSDLELVRYWRNQEHVRLRMEYQEHITCEMQSLWFENLNQKNNLYYIINKGTQKIGVIHLKEIDWQRRTAEAGIFIGEINHLNTIIPMLATIALMDVAFHTFNLKTLKAKIASDNIKAILFNEGIGYEKVPEEHRNNFSYFETDAKRFGEATKRIRDTLNKLNNHNQNARLTMSNEEIALYKIDAGLIH